jgi:hypothetical protein
MIVLTERNGASGGPSKAALCATRVSAWLKDEPDLPTHELLRRAKAAGYAGKNSSGEHARNALHDKQAGAPAPSRLQRSSLLRPPTRW